MEKDDSEKVEGGYKDYRELVWFYASKVDYRSHLAHTKLLEFFKDKKKGPPHGVH